MTQSNELEYTVARSKRKTVTIAVGRDGTVSVRAPQAATDEQIQRMVEKKLPWIYRTLAQWNALNREPGGKEFVSGETFYFLGQPCRLDLVSDAGKPLEQVGDRLVLRRELSGRAEELLRAFYRKAGYDLLPPMIAAHSRSMGVRPGKLRVWDLKHRWASCSPAGNLNFHWRAMGAPLDVLHYLVVHELAHLKAPNHTPEFWQLVDTEMADWRGAAAWLREHGARMTL